MWMWELDCEESWAQKYWCFSTVVLEKTLESPLDWKEIQPVHPKGDQSWVFIGRTNAETETLILWRPHAKSWLWKSPWCWERMRAGEEVDDSRWDRWMASPTWWAWVWVNSGSWWWTGRPGVLRFMGSQRVRCNWATELNWWHSRTSQVALVVKNLPTNAGDLGDTDSIPRLGRHPEEGHGSPLQYSCLENPMNRGTLWATVHGAAKSWIWLKWLSTHPWHCNVYKLMPLPKITRIFRNLLKQPGFQKHI